MKKFFIFVSIVAVFIGAYFFFRADALHYFGRHNGAIVLGDKAEVQRVLSTSKDKISAQQTYVVKEGIVGDKKVLFLSKTTAEALHKKRVFQTIKKAKGNGIDLEKLSTLPSIPAGKGILFTREEWKEILTKEVESEHNVTTEYKSDTIISGSRLPQDASYVIVDNNTFSSIKASEKLLAVFLTDGDSIHYPDAVEYSNTSIKP
ncbi:lipoprotein BA_5634 family protein [Thermoactinomyces sp. DSM 45892]|uniref:lipoprotein BA_5634 family protein n=1 Tax=Thermoactinomyces sp. DSM 45892 TaxID=1882753 RepID=UPI00089BE86A|nr:lipoprotein BA_5634 family protein [Thermoactinomyces sp. DSM 45892]SDY58758.1 hypothetical protein SAMN05444416_10649 [Thermoactinomyces sp. DSM 45892]